MRRRPTGRSGILCLRKAPPRRKVVARSAGASPARTALRMAAFAAALALYAGAASAFSSQIHERVTRNAFQFMAADVLDAIVRGNHDEDEGAEKDLAERHAQNCRFRDSAAYVNMRY